MAHTAVACKQRSHFTLGFISFITATGIVLRSFDCVCCTEFMDYTCSPGKLKFDGQYDGNFYTCCALRGDSIVPGPSVYNASQTLLWAPSSLSYKPQSRRRLLHSFVAYLLLTVEHNPGPTDQLAGLIGGRVNSSQLVNVGCLNCCSVANKIAVLHDIIDSNQLDIFALQETWCTTDTPASLLRDVAPSGYTALHVPRMLVRGGPTRGGGLAVVHRD
jgi:hypothetical protein